MSTAPAAGVNLAGYLESVLGIGEVARRVEGALRAAGTPVSVYTISADAARLPGASGLRQPARHPLNLLCVNAEGMEGARAELGEDWFGSRYTIGFWWWETAAFPDRWMRAFDLLDEVWVGSHAIADALAAVSPVPVVRMPVPVEAPPVGLLPAALARVLEADAPPGAGSALAPLFVLAFDYGAVVERKNPRGAIEAFRRAFPGGEPAGLVLKSIGAERHPEQHASLVAAVAGDRRVCMIDAALPRAEQGALLAGCDCYLSLHRAEGFGLPIAEAMALGKPVIATAAGGPQEYLDESNAYLVRQRPVPIGSGNDPYPADGIWAEPDLDHAAELMRAVAADVEEAARRGARARADIERAHSPAVAAAAMRARLDRVANLPVRDGKILGMEMRELERRIAGQPPQAAAGLLRYLREPLRRAVLRTIRPQAVHQRAVDEEIARTLRLLDERVQGLAVSHATLLAELEAVRARLDGEGPDRV